MTFDSSLYIVGCARNIAPYLSRVLANIETICSWFPKSYVFLFENDSFDGTGERLAQWCASKADRQIHRTELALPSRTQRIAFGRNLLVDRVRAAGTDLMLMVDLDDVFAGPVRRESFESCFSHENWDVMTAAGGPSGYYDIWALRAKGVMETDCWTLSNAQNAIKRAQTLMAAQPGVLEVESAFNVGALYRVSAIHPCCRYNGSSTCEHVSFHRCLRSRATGNFDTLLARPPSQRAPVLAELDLFRSRHASCGRGLALGKVRRKAAVRSKLSTVPTIAAMKSITYDACASYCPATTPNRIRGTWRDTNMSKPRGHPGKSTSPPVTKPEQSPTEGPAEQPAQRRDIMIARDEQLIQANTLLLAEVAKKHRAAG